MQTIGRRDFLRRLSGWAAIAVAASTIQILWPGNAGAAGPEIEVNHTVSSSETTFDPQNPPAEKPAGEDAFTQCPVTCNFSNQFVTRRKSSEGFCPVEITIKSVKIAMHLAIKISMPSAPSAQATAEEKLAWRVLLKHEEGHSLICRKLFDAIAEKVARKRFRAPPGFSFILPADDCNDKAAKKESQKRVADLLQELCEKTAEAVAAELETAGKAYDSATASGTKAPVAGGGSEPATRENQTQAAKKVAADAEAAFDAAHH